MSKKSASGAGSIRKRSINGKTYWEARYTVGRDPGTGRQIQRSISGKTQREVAQKLKAITASIDAGTYQAPSKLTVSQWMDTWVAEYLGSLKPRSVESYKSIIRLHIQPHIGAVRLEALTPATVQKLYNRLASGTADKPGLSPKTIRGVHGVLHKALAQAVEDKMIPFNPADNRKLPSAVRRELHPLDETEIAAFLTAIQGHELEELFLVTIFTGLRQGEVLGLTWDCVDFKAGTLTINKQLQRASGTHQERYLATVKNSRVRVLAPAPSVMETLKRVRAKQNQQRLKAGSAWSNPEGFVFTNGLGQSLHHHTVYHRFKAVAESIGCPDTRFHDLRHNFAIISLQSGDDVKTVQENLGHASSSFTLDIYGHVSEQMKRSSADRMESFIRSVSG